MSDVQNAGPERNGSRPPGSQQAGSGGPQRQRPEQGLVSMVSIKEFARLQLRVAEVSAAERVEGTDKLLKIQIDLGNEQRQIVAGIAARYTADRLVGRKIVVVTNLEPARIRGVDSQGMLLAAVDADGQPVIATFDEPVPVGAQVR